VIFKSDDDCAKDKGTSETPTEYPNLTRKGKTHRIIRQDAKEIVNSTEREEINGASPKHHR